MHKPLQITPVSEERSLRRATHINKTILNNRQDKRETKVETSPSHPSASILLELKMQGGGRNVDYLAYYAKFPRLHVTRERYLALYTNVIPHACFEIVDW